MPETAPEGLESGSAAPRPKRKGKGKRKHTVMKVVAVSAVVLALVTGMTVTYAYRHLNGNLTTLDVTDAFVEPPLEKAESEGPKAPLNILVMGSDSREGEGNNIDGLTGGGQRSDTTILLHLSADRKRAYGISVPRDSLVERPDCRDDDGDLVPGASDVMWNEAFNLAGPGCTISQFEQTTGVPVDHYVVLDFQGFQDMVDAVGGVKVCIPELIDDREHGIYLEAGTREISGKQALSYVRQRYAVGDGSDIGRLKRQQAFMSSMANKVVSANTLANPFTLYDFLDAATKSLYVDPGLKNLMKIAKLGYQFKDIGLDNIQFSTIPSGYAPDDPNRIRWLPAAQQVWDRIKNDEPLTARQSSEAISAGEVPGSSSSSSPTKSGSTSTGTGTNEDEAEARADAGLCA
jgi:LCP family protein required for cell wall assembly